MKKFSLIFGLLLMISLFTPTSSEATSFKRWDVEVTIQKNGDAIIKNTWKTTETKGTEKFIPIQNLGDSFIVNYTVKDNGVPLKWVDNWNVNDSRRAKKGKYGMVRSGNGHELCFGIGEYGDHTYEIQYTITNFVKNLEDAQASYWKFVNDKMTEMPEDIEIRVQGYEPFTSDTVKMWAFGFKGDIHLVDGKVVAKSSRPLDDNNYAVLLLQYPEHYFNTTSRLNKTSKELQDQAFENSDYSREENKESSGFQWFYLLPLVSVVFGIFSAGAGVTAAYKASKGRYAKRAKELKEQYYREVPYKGPFIEEQYILKEAGLYNPSHLFSAFFLKWVKEKAIEPVKTEEGMIFKKDKTNLKILQKPAFQSEAEKDLFDLIQNASGDDNILEEREFSKHVKRHYKKFEKLLKDIEQHSKRIMARDGYTHLKEKRFIIKWDEVDLSEKGFELLDRNIMFRNYLKDYSLLNEKEAVNVHIWDDFMIYAALYGIAEEVMKQFNTLYPEYVSQSAYSPETILWANMYSNSMYRTYQNTAASRSSGGGGFSSMGGGGGSFGGGSGGGTR